MQSLSTEVCVPLLLNLKHDWKISRASCSEKENIFVILEENGRRFYGEGAPNARYGEFYADNNAAVLRMQYYQNALNNALFAKSLCLGRPGHASDLEALFRVAHQGTSVLSYPIGTRVESMSGRTIKLKVDQDNWKDLLAQNWGNKSLIIDANEAFNDWGQFMLFYEQSLQCPAIEVLEQPFPSARVDLGTRLKRMRPPYCLIGDESFSEAIHWEIILGQFDGINIKLNKSGGVQHAWDQLLRARELGLKTMLGCMIETGLGLLYAAPLAAKADFCDLDGATHLKHDPFKRQFFVDRQTGEFSLAKTPLEIFDELSRDDDFFLLGS